jgi:hypothetical protein
MMLPRRLTLSRNIERIRLKSGFGDLPGARCHRGTPGLIFRAERPIAAAGPGSGPSSEILIAIRRAGAMGAAKQMLASSNTATFN